MSKHKDCLIINATIPYALYLGKRLWYCGIALLRAIKIT